jgi:hypothetical protein
MLPQAFYGGTKDHALHGMPNVRMRPTISGVDRTSPRRRRRQTLSFIWGYGERGHASLRQASLEPAIQAPTMHLMLLGLSQAIVVVAKMGTQTGALWKRSCFGEIVLRCCVGEIEPKRQRLYILRVDRRAAPDPKAGRRIAIGADIKGDFFFFEQARE